MATPHSFDTGAGRRLPKTPHGIHNCRLEEAGRPRLLSRRRHYEHVLPPVSHRSRSGCVRRVRYQTGGSFAPRTRTRPGSTIQSRCSLHSADKTGRTRLTNSSVCRRLGSTGRNTTMPTYSLGAYALMSAKSRSRGRARARLPDRPLQLRDRLRRRALRRRPSRTPSQPCAEGWRPRREGSHRASRAYGEATQGEAGLAPGPGLRRTPAPPEWPRV
jgi:hypothetical protein